MAEIGFYHLTRSSLEQALPRLLAKALAAGHRVVLRVGTRERLADLDRHLWTYDPASFLPHGSSADGFADEQPIWLTIGNDRPNGARVLVLVDGAALDDLEAYDRALDLFDGRDDEAVGEARRRWSLLRKAGHALVYWRQNEAGGWIAEHRVEASASEANS